MKLTTAKDWSMITLSIVAIALGIYTHMNVTDEMEISRLDQNMVNQRESNRDDILFFSDITYENMYRKEAYMSGLISSKENTHLTPEGEKILVKFGITARMGLIYADNSESTIKDVIWNILSTDKYQKELYKLNKNIKDEEKRISLEAVLGATIVKWQIMQGSQSQKIPQ